jgi:hypothetical protein
MSLRLVSIGFGFCFSRAQKSDRKRMNALGGRGIVDLGFLAFLFLDWFVGGEGEEGGVEAGADGEETGEDVESEQGDVGSI